MPELPEVAAFKKYFDGTSLKKKILDLEINDSRILKVPSENFAETIKGQSFGSSQRIGKYFFANLSQTGVVVFHFGMTGSFHYYKDPEDQPKYAQVIFAFDNSFKLAYISRRKLGWLDIADSVQEYVQKIKLGEDALSIGFEDFYNKINRGKSFIKPRLMDQKLMAGVGNWIADEILYQSKIHPESLIQKLTNADFEVMYQKMQEVLKTAVKLDAVQENYPEHYLVHNRHTGGKCYHTGEELVKIEVGGRGTFYSPHWQTKK